MNTTWYLFNQPVGQTQRDTSCANLHILCPQCGAIWARVESIPQRHWTCSHRRCPACSTGSLAGADWTSRPYAPLNLPSALLVRELDLASSHPDTYDRSW